ncbi:MAG: signal peptidase I, partial [Betaproteobacteria bacterium]
MTLDPGAMDAGEPAAGEVAIAVVEGGPAGRASSGSRAWRAVWEFLHDLSVAVLFCFFLITFVAQAFRVQGTSMEPLLSDGERIVVNKFVYRFRPIERGDVVVFWYPRDPSVSFIKRVVALPGDQVEIRSGQLYVNGQQVQETYLPAA